MHPATYSHGTQVDPAAEETLERWATPQPEDAEFLPIPRASDDYPFDDYDPADAQVRRMEYDGDDNERFHERYL